VGVMGDAVLVGGGGFHCASQQMPVGWGCGLRGSIQPEGKRQKLLRSGNYWHHLLAPVRVTHVL